MRRLADHPDLNQLRRQARELQRAAAAGEPEAAARLAAVAMRPTLSAALLALAREHGFSSWPRLKTEVERRARLRVRPVASPAELEAAFDVVGAQFTPPLTHDDRRFADLARRFAEDRPLMQVALDGGRIVGGALAFRTSAGWATLRVLAVTPDVRGLGLGQRLVRAVEAGAMRLGVTGIALAAAPEVRTFYQRLGYRGRRSRLVRALPLPGRAAAVRLSAAGRSRPWPTELSSPETPRQAAPKTDDPPEAATPGGSGGGVGHRRWRPASARWR